ncbi:MAG: RDD family protein [Oligoflexus sp.]|nr:RDD family protein [Oligoflexus sp.]
MNQPLSAPPRFASPDAKKIEPAGFGIRFLANIIDGIILGVMTLPISLVFGRFQNKAHPSIKLTILSNLILLILAGFYYAYFYSKKGASPGKSMLNLRVVDFNTGTNPSFQTAFIRDTIGKLLSAVVLMGGYVIVLFRSDKRAMHDLISDTQVIRLK